MFDQNNFKNDFLGESGANDSMIPCMDNLLQVTSKLPSNPLTEVLKDFRRYRPINHKEFLDYVYNKANQIDVRGFALMVNFIFLIFFLILMNR